jgi:GNAT superfamily N-acetyltransferase
MEVALIVRSDRKRLGIGTALLEESRRRAEAARCRALWGMILWENVSMRCLAARMGFRAAGVSGLAMQVRLVLSGG